MWLQQGDRYRIVFVDPKGMRHTDYLHKLNGYSSIFAPNGHGRTIRHNGMGVSVSLFCYNPDAPKADDHYRRFWAGSIAELLRNVGASYRSAKRVEWTESASSVALTRE